MVNENPNRTILLIEDDFGIAEMLETFFRTQGFNITTRDQGLVGVATAAELVPDLVILDIRLPDIDGFEVARRLPREPFHKWNSDPFSLQRGEIDLICSKDWN